MTSQRLTSPKWVKCSLWFQSQNYIIWKGFRRGVKQWKPFLATTRTTRVIRLQRNLISPPGTTLFLKKRSLWYFFHSFWQNKLIFRWHIRFIVGQNRIILDFWFLTQSKPKSWSHDILWRHKLFSGFLRS